MAVTYGFYNSLNKDRVYNAEQMSAIFNGVITDGVFASIGGKLIPTAGSGMQVIVKTGKCWFNSTWTLNDAELPLSIPVADVSLTRIDAIVVEINSAVSTRANSIKVVPGTASANPAKPTLASSSTLHQYALGYVTVPANATSISASNIEVNVGKSTCPFVTSVLQQTNIDDLFNQWNSQFLAWFNNVQAQLSGDVAANLQAQIEAITQDGYGKNGVLPTITISTGIRQLYSGLDTLLENMTVKEDKRFYVYVSTVNAWAYGGGSWIGHLRKMSGAASALWDSATLYSYMKDTPVLFLTRNGSTNSWDLTEVVKSGDLGGSFRIGDVRQALPNMSVPSADWHECDGTQFDPNAYPILAPMCAQEMTKFQMLPNSSLEAILSNLRPSYVDTRYWATKIHYVYSLEKYYAYTWSTQSSSYGTNKELASEIDKCVIFDPKTNTYEVHNATYSTTASGYSGLINTVQNAEYLYFNKKDNCFYCGLYSKMYDDSDDDIYYIEFGYCKSSNGYIWDRNTLIRNSTIDHTWAHYNGELDFTICNGKFHVIIICAKLPGSPSNYNQIWFWNFDSASSLSSFTFGTANYTSRDITYDDRKAIYPVYDLANGTEEFFFKQYYTSSSRVETMEYMYRYSPSGQYSQIPCKFINTYHSNDRQYNVSIAPYKIKDQYVIHAYAQAYTNYVGLSSETAIKNGQFSSMDALTYNYDGPYYDPVMNFIYMINANTIQWISYNSPHGSATTGKYTDTSSPGIANAIKTTSGVTRFLGTKCLYERVFNSLYCRKYPTISVTGLKTFVRQQIS